MDPFAVVILGGLLGLIIFCLLLGKLYPGSGADVLDWRPSRSYEQRVAAEIEDLDQMLEAANMRRRRRGEAELTEHTIHERVRQDRTEAQKRRDAYLDEQDLEQMVEARNARRRARGLPEMSVEDVRAEVAKWRAS
jgi:uncharacterized protein YkwD